MRERRGGIISASIEASSLALASMLELDKFRVTACRSQSQLIGSTPSIKQFQGMRNSAASLGQKMPKNWSDKKQDTKS